MSAGSRGSNVSISAEEHARLSDHKAKLTAELQAVEHHLSKIETRRASRLSKTPASRPLTGC